MKVESLDIQELALAKRRKIGEYAAVNAKAGQYFSDADKTGLTNYFLSLKVANKELPS